MKQNNQTVVCTGMAMALAALVLHGCATDAPMNDDPESTDHVQAPEQLDEKGAEVAAESAGKRRGAPELVLRWDEPSTDFAASNLTLVVSSTAPESITAELEVQVKSPAGEHAKLSLGTIELAPGATEKLEIPVEALPVQTEGVAAMLHASVSWESAVPGSTNPDDLEPARRSASAEVRFATWSGKAKAQVRSAIAQRRVVQERAVRGEMPQLTALRVRDDEQGTLVARETRDALVLTGEGFSGPAQGGPATSPNSPPVPPAALNGGEN